MKPERCAASPAAPFLPGGTRRRSPWAFIADPWYRAALLAALLLAGPPAAAAEDFAWRSDRFSFVGGEPGQRVVFAIDIDRGRDGDGFQAGLFVVLHEEGRGWQPLAGGGDYASPDGPPDALPPSPDFGFDGSAASGIVIDSPAQGLSLRVRPVHRLLSRFDGGDEFHVGVASAVLEWRGREIAGRVIHEELRLDGWNRPARGDPGAWKEFHGFYLVAGDGGDVYLHSQQGEALAGLLGTVDGVALAGGELYRLADAALAVTDTDFAFGFYRWPVAWRGHWPAGNAEPAVRLEFRLAERQTHANRILGGFAMGIVSGEIAIGGRVLPVYGLGELIR